jgi:hypothetical protein
MHTKVGDAMKEIQRVLDKIRSASLSASLHVQLEDADDPSGHRKAPHGWRTGNYDPSLARGTHDSTHTSSAEKHSDELF